LLQSLRIYHHELSSQIIISRRCEQIGKYHAWLSLAKTGRNGTVHHFTTFCVIIPPFWSKFGVYGTVGIFHPSYGGFLLGIGNWIGKERKVLVFHGNRHLMSGHRSLKPAAHTLSGVLQVQCSHTDGVCDQQGRRQDRPEPNYVREEDCSTRTKLSTASW
jgi:hypothetical protein